MGAAGIVAALLALRALDGGVLPGSAGTGAVDPALGDRFGGQLQLQPAHRTVRNAALHAFGFGGNNAVLIFDRG